MGINLRDGGYSTRVEIFVLIEGEMVPVSQIGPHSFVLREPRRGSLGPAELLIRIDDQEERHPVVITSEDPTATEMAYF